MHSFIFNYHLYMQTTLNLSLKLNYLYELQTQIFTGLLEGANEVHRAGKQYTLTLRHHSNSHLSKTHPSMSLLPWIVLQSPYSLSSEPWNHLPLVSHTQFDANFVLWLSQVSCIDTWMPLPLCFSNLGAMLLIKVFYE